MTEFSDGVTLGAARQWLRDQVRDEGAICPCCRQMAKVYKRSINATQARALIAAWKAVGRMDFHQPTILKELPGGDYAKLRFWGLIEDLQERREDGGRGGWWRITDLGEAWARGKIGVPRHAYVYNNQLLYLDDSEGEIMVRDALGEKFDYDELMSSPGCAAPI